MAADMGGAPRIAGRMDDIEPFYVMDVMARARELEGQGRTIVHMEIGEPDFLTPRPVIDAAQQALQDGRVHYTPATGLAELRQAISTHYREQAGLEIDPGRIIVTPGASGALLLALGVLLNPGDEVLMADPGYPCNRHFVRFVEGRARAVPVGPASRYQLSPEHVEREWGPATKAVMVASPSNPTGTLLETDQIAALARVVAAQGGTLIVDEIYHGLTYGLDARTALTVSDDVFVINSFSKYFCMTGWRLGWLVVPDAYRRAVEKLAQNLFIAPPTLAQYAALAAFAPETRVILEGYREEFMRRRDYLLPALQALGFDIPVMPQGAFYLYADCSRVCRDSRTFAMDLLEDAGVAVTPGVDFGRHHPERHIRFAYTTSMDMLREGVRRIADFLRR